MRAQHIDVARALCIVLVVFGHSELAEHFSDANTILTSFRMPLFFLLAGAFFAPGQSLSETVRRKSDGLLKPYISLAVLYTPFYLMRHGEASLGDYAWQVLSFSGKDMPGWLMPMWFLTLLWALHVGGRLFVDLTGFSRSDRARQVCWIVVLLMGGYGLLRLFAHLPADPLDEAWPHRGLPFNLQLWPLTAAFFFTGHVLSRNIRAWSWGTSSTIVAALVFCAAHMLYEPSINLLEPYYADLVVTTVTALSGSLTVIGFSHALARIQVVRRVVAPVGELSLYILMFHAPLQSLASKMLGVLLPGAESTLIAAGAMLASLLASFVMGRTIRGMPACQMLFEPAHRAAPVKTSRSVSAGSAAASLAISEEEAAHAEP